MTHEESRAERLAGVLDEFLVEQQLGRAPSRETLLRRHPDLAGDLDECLRCLDLVERGSDVEPGADERLVGGVLGDFRIIREVGRGGMGVVYEAEQISLGRRVALKVLPFAAVFDERHLERFRNEAQAAAFLHHTHIVPVHAVGQERGVHYYAMQFIEGRSLAQVIEELKKGAPEPSQPLSVITQGKSTQSAEYCRAVARIGIQASEALAHAHERGVIHRDIKPANLMVDPLGHLWVTDFGLASFQRSDANLTLTGDLLGTVRYMSPEQALAQRVPIDHRTDVYSLGVTLYELLTLEPAFGGDHLQAVMEAIAFRDPVSARTLNPAIPPDLETILLKAMAKDPSDRYVDAKALRDDLARFLDHKPIRAKRPSLWARADKWARRHRPLVAAGVVSLLLLTGVLIWKNVQVGRAYEAAEDQRLRAEEDFARARRAVREMLAQAGAESLRDVPLMEPVRAALLESAVQFYEEWLRDARGRPELSAEVAEALEELGQVRRMSGHYDAADEDYRKALELADDPPARARILHRLGLLRLESGDLDGASRSLDEALAIRRAGDPLAWAQTLRSLGKVAERKGDKESAARRIDEAIEILERVSTTDGKLLLAEVLSQRAENRFLDRREEGEVDAVRAAALLREIAAEPDAPRECPARLGAILVNHAQTRRSLGDPTGALPLLREAVEVLDPYVRQFPFSMSARSGLCEAHRGIGGCLRDADPRAAVHHLRESVRGGEELVLLFPDAPHLRGHLAFYHLALAPTVRATDPETARRSIARAESLMRGLVESFQDEPGYVRDLTSVLQIRSTMESFPENVKVVREAIRLLQPLFDREPNRPAYRNSLANYHNQAGYYFHPAGRIDDAVREFREAIDLYRGRPDFDARKGCAMSLMNLGNLLKSQRHFGEAAKALREAISIHDRLIEDDPARTGLREGRALARVHLGDVVRLDGGPKDSLTCYRAAITDLEQLESRKPVIWMLYADTLWVTGMVRRKLFGVLDPDSLALRTKAIDVRAEFLRLEPQRNGQRRRLASDAHQLANDLNEANRLDGVEEYFRIAHAQREHLVLHADGKHRFRSELAQGLHDHAAFLVVRRDSPAPAQSLLERAVSLQRQALLEKPDNQRYGALLVQHLDLWGQASLALSDHARATEVARQLASEARGSERAHAQAARLYAASSILTLRDPSLSSAERDALARECYIRAIRQLRRATEIRNDAAELHRRLAWALAACPFDDLTDLDAAEKAAARALALGDAEAHQAFGVALLRRGDTARALPAITKTMKASGGSPRDWYCIAILKGTTGGLESARSALRKADELARGGRAPSLEEWLLREWAVRTAGIDRDRSGEAVGQVDSGITSGR